LVSILSTSLKSREAVTPPASRAAEFDVLVGEGQADGRYWRDLFRYHELLLILAWRDIAVRYKQTAVGVAWVVGRPLLTVVALTIVFGKFAGLPSGGAPYALLVMAAVLPWQLFSNSLTSASGSVVGNAGLISKVYFPRLIIPLSSLLSQLPDFALTVLMVVPLLVYYGASPGWPMLLAPLFVVLALGNALGCGLWLGALNVRYRDVNHIAPFLVQLGLYVSPVGYSTSLVPERWRAVYALNPMVGIIDGFRWCVLGDAAEPYWPGVALSVATTGVLLVVGAWYFRRTERTFADVI
jgi:lipopolysaccharide transport system permease protein